jgi:diacyltrehalose acyltransferase
MNKLLAGAIAVGVVSVVGSIGAVVNSVATADTSYNVGGARVPGVPWYDYTYRAGAGYYPDATRVIVDYPAGMVQGRTFKDLFPGPDWDGPTVGESVAAGKDNLDGAIRGTTDAPARAVGLSEGALVLGAEQSRLAGDATAPPPDQLSFSYFGDPAGNHAFGKGVLTALFKPGTYVPIIDYTVSPPVESQYDTTKVVAAYDGVADYPDRPDNFLAMLNAAMGAALVHTAVAFTGPEEVPPQNIRTTTNSEGATTTTYLIPNKQLPLTLPLRYLGMNAADVDRLDATLQPIIDEGYVRNDNPAAAPIAVDPVVGVDPLTGVDAETRANFDKFFSDIRSIMPPGGY